MTPMQTSQNIQTHQVVYPVQSQSYQSQPSVPTGMTPRHQVVVAQLQQLHMQQQQQQQMVHPEYYNVSASQQQQQPKLPLKRRQVSRDSSRWSLLDEDLQQKPEEQAYANEAIILQHQQNMMYSAGGDLSDAPLPPLPPGGHNQDEMTKIDRYYHSQQRHSRHSSAFDDMD